ncbi:hypothetical protein NA57DRAFT_42483, partial [Rhizodiscina lignyota]
MASDAAAATVKPLSASLVRHIGSSQSLTEPSSVVKELIDNALDARASSISIEISPNTVDFIQVRDNGHGIAPEDRQLVARRHCTSKIRDIDDLKKVGGTSLGFRGVALASIAAMSSALAITTRVEGEEVAIKLHIGKDGEVEREERVSQAAGTTVRATQFLDTLPVRKQTALKNTSKELAEVRRLLQAYALARPTVRISFRVTKAKSEKGNFTYAPKTNASVEDAVFKVVGKDCASQCGWSVWEGDGFVIQACLPRPDAQLSNISNVGSFISIDGRPVSAVRGIPKEITRLFKEKLRAVHTRLQEVKHPFSCLKINCPPESYDPNIEPAKDNVLFDNPDGLLTAVGQLLDVTY